MTFMHDHKTSDWHTHESSIFPFTAIIGQDLMKDALIYNTINPSIGGVLIKGEKGTAKSTAARALTELLPHIKVVKDCKFHCDPDPAKYDDLCSDCKKKIHRGEILEVSEQHMKFLNLPVSATEDRVVGTIDLKKALTQNEITLEPGILAEVNRGILYIDEVNLLDNHVADILLDAAAMGYNIIERESISFFHPARFVLVGTMNPEEGDLRPQLLDRFGLSVDVKGVDDINLRMAIIKARQEFDMDKVGFKEKCKPQQKALVEKIIHAKEILPLVKIEEEYLKFISTVCIQLGTEGHRADIVIAKTAQTIAAFEGRTIVYYQDIKKAMLLALPHRFRKGPFKTKKFDQKEFETFIETLRTQMGIKDKPENNENKKDNNNDSGAEPSQEMKKTKKTSKKKSTENEHRDQKSHNEQSDHDHHNHEHKDHQHGDKDNKGLESLNSTKVENIDAETLDSIIKDQSPTIELIKDEQIFEIGAGIAEDSKKEILKKNLKDISQKSKGRNTNSSNINKMGVYNGRYRNALPNENINNIAFDATLKASLIESSRTKEPFQIKPHHYKIKIRKSPTNVLIIFLLDSSGSMAPKKRMAAAKGAIYSLMEEIYIRKDKICLITFSGTEANMVLPPTNSIDLASNLLEQIPTGGKTPLSAGLHKAIQIALDELNIHNLIPMIILLSDGKNNVPLYESFDQDKEIIGELLESHSIPLICIDTDLSSFNLGFAKQLSEEFDAIYYRLDQLHSEQISKVISHEYKEMIKILDTA